MDSSAKAHSNEVGRGSLERKREDGFKLSDGQGHGVAEHPHWSGEKTGDCTPSAAGFADPAGREGATCAHTPVHCTHTSHLCL